MASYLLLNVEYAPTNLCPDSTLHKVSENWNVFDESNGGPTVTNNLLLGDTSYTLSTVDRVWTLTPLAELTA